MLFTFHQSFYFSISVVRAFYAVATLFRCCSIVQQTFRIYRFLKSYGRYRNKISWLEEFAQQSFMFSIVRDNIIYFAPYKVNYILSSKSSL